MHRSSASLWRFIDLMTAVTAAAVLSPSRPPTTVRPSVRQSVTSLTVFVTAAPSLGPTPLLSHPVSSGSRILKRGGQIRRSVWLYSSEVQARSVWLAVESEAKPRETDRAEAEHFVCLISNVTIQYNTIQWIFLERRDVYARWVQRRL